MRGRGGRISSRNHVIICRNHGIKVITVARAAAADGVMGRESGMEAGSSFDDENALLESEAEVEAPFGMLGMSLCMS